MPVQLDWLAECADRSRIHPPQPRKLARVRDPDTSKRAAEKAISFVAGHNAKCFGAICEAGERGATAKEIAAVTKLTDVQVNRRLSSMGERKLIERRLRKGATSETDFERRGGCAVWWARK